jgi:Flp pilus assembly protein TadG
MPARLGRAVARFARRDGGAAAVELALVAPVLLILVFGVIDFGRALFTMNVLTAAMREGARRGASSGINSSAPDLATACSVAQAYVSNALSVTLTCSSSGTCPTTTANTICASYSSPLITLRMPGGYTFTPAAGFFSRMGTTLRPKQAAFRWEMAS